MARVDKVTAKDKYRLACPMCENKIKTMRHRDVNGTHIWTCSECPAVLVEYIEVEDANNLAEFLRSE